MSAPSDDNNSKSRITLPPIRDLFRDEFMRSPHPRHSPSMALAQLRVNDEDNSNAPSVRSQSPPLRIHPPCLHRSSSEHSCPSLIPPTFDRDNRPHITPPYPSTYRPSGPPSAMPPSLPLPRAQRADRLLSHGSSDPSVVRPHPHSNNPSQSLDRQQDRSLTTPSNHHRHLIHASSSYPNLRAPTEPSNLAQAPRLPALPHPATSNQLHSPDSPPALVRAIPPWIIATNLNMGQVYEDEERTPVARPFEAGPMTRSTSYPIPLGRFLDEGSQTPLGKYDCKFCGKLFNRPSSLRIHLNSHTGEKPFVCPKEGCGRSFSVLSNMRRHARVHTQEPKEQEESSDEASRKSSPAASAPSTSGTSTSTISQETALAQTGSYSGMHFRRDSNASVSTTSSRRSRSVSSDRMEEELERPEKRSKHHAK